MYSDVLRYEPGCILFYLSAACSQVTESCWLLICLNKLPDAFTGTLFKPGDELLSIETGAQASWKECMTTEWEKEKIKRWKTKGEKEERTREQPLTISFCYSSLAERSHTTRHIFKSEIQSQFYLPPHSFYLWSTSGYKWQRNVWTIQMDKKKTQHSVAE